MRTLDSFPITKVRADFPWLDQHAAGRIAADNAATSLKPRVVVEAVTGYLAEYSANIHRGDHALSERATAAYEASRQMLARFIGARRAELVFVRGTTEAINLVAAGLGLRPHENVIATLLEHHSNLLPWRARCQLRLAPLDENGLPDLHAAAALIDEHTRGVAVTACSNVTGVRVPVREWADMAHRHGVPLVVDAAQSLAHERLDVVELDCDFLAGSGHKALGPTGAGFLYGKRERLEQLAPLNYGGGAVGRVDLDGSFQLRDVPWRFEAGTPDIAAAIGLGAAIEYLDGLGMAAITQHEAALCAALDEHVASIAELEPVAVARGVARAPILCVRARDPSLRAEVLARMLADRFGVLTRAGHHCAHPLHEALGIGPTLRISLAFYNSVGEVEAIAEALRTVLRSRS
jgi:cysteine desulfurase/selenocysteine lyase